MYKSLLFLLLALTTGCGLFAQEVSGSMSGRIVDNANAFLSGVTVTAVHTPTGTKYVTTTNGYGRYALVNLRVGGPYTISITFTGMKPQVKDSILISLGQPSVIDFVMTPETKSMAEVVIMAVAPNKANLTGAGLNISSSQIKNMPSGARSFQDYTKLTPQYNGNSFVGTNFRYNNVTIDGAINNDAIGFSPSLGGQTGTSGQIGSSTRTNPISIDAIQDIQVAIAPFDVKIGNFTGGSINAVTRSGTNKLDGSIYVFDKNSALVGKDYAGGTGKMPSAFHDVQAGFRVGFPIIKDKLFFFTNEELTDRVDPLTETASSAIAQQILTQADAEAITSYLKSNFGYDPGTTGAYNVYSRSKKFFNRVDWNISPVHQLALRSNIVYSNSTNLTRDDQNFRFSSQDYVSRNNQNATVAELKSRFNNTFANSLVVGYTAVHDYRDPKSYAYYPQMQIGGETLGTTILLGTDREASVFNMRQNSFELTDNFTVFKNRNTWTFGTHNEFYNITYGFINSPNGRIDYPTVQAFLLAEPSRIRGNYNYADQDRNYLLSHPSAKFKANIYSAYAEDEIRISDNFKLIPGLRLDMTSIPQKQPLSIKTVRAMPDPFYGSTYTYTRPQSIRNDYLGQVQPSPRIGFNWNITGDRKVVLRGGSGLFIGRIPFAWLGYAFYNNGNSYGSFDKRYDYVGNPTAIPPVPPTVPNPGTNPQRPSPTGIAASAIGENGKSALNSNGPTQVDLVDNHFKMPQVWRTSAALDWSPGDGYKFTIEGVFTKTIYDVKFQQINQQDSASYYQYDTRHQQPIFNGKSVDPAFTAMYLLSNTTQGYRYSATAQASKHFPFGLEVMAAYTYGQSKDVSNGIRNSMESNWQLNPSLNPNNPSLANSNFDIRHRIIGSVNYQTSYGKNHRYQSSATLFMSAASGSPFTYGFVNNSIQGTGQQVSLAYIPKPEEVINFFQSGYIQLSDGSVVNKSASDQAAEFMQYVRGNKYLSSRIGKWTERNGARTPWNTDADLRLSQTWVLDGESKFFKSMTLTFDIFNLTNLLYNKWGRSYFSSDLFNSTASVGLRPSGATQAGYPIYIWENPSTPYQTDLSQSRWQMQVGLRYNF
jgi:hypothetical protein